MNFPVRQTLMLLLNVVQTVVFAQVIISWLVSFQVLNLRQPFVYQVWSTLNRLLEPIYRPVRRVLPSMSGIDLSPLVVLLGITILSYFIQAYVWF